MPHGAQYPGEKIKSKEAREAWCMHDTAVTILSPQGQVRGQHGGSAHTAPDRHHTLYCGVWRQCRQQRPHRLVEAWVHDVRSDAAGKGAKTICM
jgi:hypothetical protein